MGKGWGVFFGVVLGACFLLTVLSPFITGWWLPPNLSTFGPKVDYLFYVILWMTGFFFVLTEVILVYAMWRYAYREGEKAQYTHGNHRLEMFWTAVPAALLLFIAFAQVKTWEEIKYQSQMPEPQQIAQVTARQWEWRIRHAAADTVDLSKVSECRDWAESQHDDDVHTVNELHTWKGANVKMYLKTQDVIHSFFLPNLRLKQDALPGKTIPMWFTANRANMIYKSHPDDVVKENERDLKGTWEHDDREQASFELACAELCGGRHYQMRGRLCVHETKEYYLDWLKATRKQQKATKPESRPGGTTVVLNPN